MWPGEVADLLDRHADLLPRALLVGIARGIAGPQALAWNVTVGARAPPQAQAAAGGAMMAGHGGGQASAAAAAAATAAAAPALPGGAGGAAAAGRALDPMMLMLGGGGAAEVIESRRMPQHDGALVCERRRRMTKVDASITSTLGAGVYQMILARSLTAMQDAYFSREMRLDGSPSSEYHVYLSESDRLDAWWRAHGGGDTMHVITRFRRNFCH